MSSWKRRSQIKRGNCLELAEEPSHRRAPRMVLMAEQRTDLEKGCSASCGKRHPKVSWWPRRNGFPIRAWMSFSTDNIVRVLDYFKPKKLRHFYKKDVLGINIYWWDYSEYCEITKQKAATSQQHSKVRNSLRLHHKMWKYQEGFAADSKCLHLGVFLPIYLFLPWKWSSIVCLLWAGKGLMSEMGNEPSRPSGRWWAARNFHPGLPFGV